MSLRRTTYEQSRLLQKLSPSSIQNILQDRRGSFDRECNFRGQVVGVRNSANMSRKGVTQQLICLLLISHGQGSHNVSQSGLAICKLHWQRISIGLVPAFKQTILALCHELHVANTYRVSSFPWVLGNLWVNMGHKPAHHPSGRARSKVLMCIEHVCCMKQRCQWITKACKGR